jgi:hypothetical protein
LWGCCIPTMQDRQESAGGRHAASSATQRAGQPHAGKTLQVEPYRTPMGKWGWGRRGREARGLADHSVVQHQTLLSPVPPLKRNAAGQTTRQQATATGVSAHGARLRRQNTARARGYPQQSGTFLAVGRNSTWRRHARGEGHADTRQALPRRRGGTECVDPCPRHAPTRPTPPPTKPTYTHLLSTVSDVHARGGNSASLRGVMFAATGRRWGQRNHLVSPSSSPTVGVGRHRPEPRVCRRQVQSPTAVWVVCARVMGEGRRWRRWGRVHHAGVCRGRGGQLPELPTPNARAAPSLAPAPCPRGNPCAIKARSQIQSRS